MRLDAAVWPAIVMQWSRVVVRSIVIGRFYYPIYASISVKVTQIVFQFLPQPGLHNNVERGGLTYGCSFNQKADKPRHTLVRPLLIWVQFGPQPNLYAALWWFR